MASAASLAPVRGVTRAALILLCTTLLAWALLIWAVLDMSSPLAQLMMPMGADWSVANLLAVFSMWCAMMAAMMLPSAAPMVLAFTSLCRRQRQPGQAGVFVAAYLLIWTAFSAGATALQWGLQAAGLLGAGMASGSIWLTGLLLVVAGAVQFTPLKQVCLRHCRTPMGFLLTEWRPGVSGAWHMGIRHGLYCLGCCWALMILLFVGGVMNLAWVAALGAAVVVEKSHPAGAGIGRILGGILIAAGIAGCIGANAG